MATSSAANPSPPPSPLLNATIGLPTPPLDATAERLEREERALRELSERDCWLERRAGELELVRLNHNEHILYKQGLIRFWAPVELEYWEPSELGDLGGSDEVYVRRASNDEVYIVVSSDEDEDVEKEGDSLRENEKEVSGSEESEDDEASEESFYSASEGDIDLTALHL